MMPVYQNFGPGVTGVGLPLALDYMPNSWITAVVEAVGAIDASIEVTLDQVFDPSGANYIDPVAATWLPLIMGPGVTPLPAFTTDGYWTFPGPWRAIRLNVTTNPTGITFAVAQSVGPRA